MGKKLEEIELRGQEISLETIRTSNEFSDYERFDLEVYLMLQEVHFKIDRIQQCGTMLDFYPEDIRTAWFTPMKRGEYLEQVMELYIMHSIGLVDRVLILYNFLFDLKLTKRNRTVDQAIKKLSKEDGFPLFAFSMIFNDVRKSRNSIAHEYRYIDHELIDLIIEDSLLQDDYRASMPEAQKLFSKLNNKYNKKMRELHRNIVKNDELLTNSYLPVLDTVERQYNKRIKELKKITQAPGPFCPGLM